MAATPGDFQALGRNVLFMVAKSIALFLVAMLAGVVGWMTYAVTGRSWTAGLMAAWPVVMLSAVALTPLVAWAFVLFDVGRDTPA